MAYPIATLANGNILYSDGTQRPNQNIASTASSAQTRRSTAVQPQVSNRAVSASQSFRSNNTQPQEDNSIVNQYNSQLSAYNEASDRYINDLLSSVGEDRDEAIRILTREHEQALGTDDRARAEFLESVSDDLERRIGTIPYDYQIGVTRTNEDTTRATSIIGRNRDSALRRLAEDEQVWKQEFGQASDKSRINQQESLNSRGLIQGTRDNVQGVGGIEVRDLERDLGNTLSAYDRALGRTREDVNTQAEDALFDVNRTSTRTLQDLRTGARRGAQGATDTYTDNTRAAELAYQRRQRELERQRELSRLQNQSMASANL